MTAVISVARSRRFILETTLAWLAGERGILREGPDRGSGRSFRGTCSLGGGGRWTSLLLGVVERLAGCSGAGMSCRSTILKPLSGESRSRVFRFQVCVFAVALPTTARASNLSLACQTVPVSFEIQDGSSAQAFTRLQSHLTRFNSS